MKRIADCGMLIADWKINNQQSEKLVSPIVNQAERGQSIALFAILIPVTTLFVLLIIDFMVTNVRVMETVAAADLAAHAGAQQVILLPDGSFEMDITAAQETAAAYFSVQAPAEAALGSVTCNLQQNRPACQVSATVPSAGYLIPQQSISVHAIGYLVYGVTEEDQ